MTGYAVGSYGFIMITMDGGATWIPQISGTLQQLNSLCITPDNSAFTAGSAGTVLRTTDMGVSVRPSPLPTLSGLSVFPNPSKDIITVIKGKMSGDRLSILNTMGQEVLTHEITSPASHIDISRLLPGLYFLKDYGESASGIKLIKK